MIAIKDKTKCCGCTACYSICPAKCIEMTEDVEGFLYPKVDLNKCINCNQCEKVCPILDNDILKKNSAIRDYYIVQVKDERIRKESTSGGAFTPLAEVVIDKGGVVFGASFEDHKTYKVSHNFVQNKADLKIFRGSKYVQSSMENSMRECKMFLDNGRLVLFSGTPCQIAGLKEYLKKDYQNLITLDVVCRAVPSPKVFRKYLDYQRIHFNSKIENVRFRDKTYGYNYSTMSLYTDSGKNYHKGIESDLYLRMFFSGICDRPSCSNCKFRFEHLSDITIWDCFDVSSIDSSFDDNKGTTRMMVQSEIGKDLLLEAKDYFRIRSYIPNEKKKEVAYSENKEGLRKEFFEDIDELNVDVFFNKYFPFTMKVRFLGYIRYLSYRLGIYRVLKKVWNLYKNR